MGSADFVIMVKLICQKSSKHTQQGPESIAFGGNKNTFYIIFIVFQRDKSTNT